MHCTFNSAPESAFCDLIVRIIIIESLERETAFDSDTDKGMVRYLIGKYKEAVQIPASLQGELNQANADGQLAWGKCYGSYSICHSK